ncbi:MULTISPECIES: hypothetical protein [Paenibacillus]|uniref:Uncharacterized protein n=2 Tax=Paenibacillus TaxID=44249 RepID=A0ABX2ZAE7_PAEPO|nr:MULTISPECIES: hypothetical protein [Paenibacillus]MDR6779409.1 hypothetical protein [Paenibacillus peoriae]ODA08305.1 hypothetical protein A7312_27600 [Paenibacillus polymyxa]
MVVKIKNLGYGLSALSFVYAIYAYFIKHLLRVAPDTREFMGSQISNSLNKDLVQALNDYTVSIPFAFIFLAIGIAIIFANKYFD